MHLDDNAENVVYHPDIDYRVAVLRESSVVDEFYQQNTCNPDGTESVSFSDPIYILFNQERLDSLGSTAVQAFLDSLQPKSDALAELRSKCSDDDLMQMMKSRHLQSPAEILHWCRYMKSNVDKFNAEVQELVKQQSQQQTNNVNTETNNSE